MPKQVQPLTQLQVRNAKAKDKPYKLADGGGLYLEVMPSGGKLWRMKFRQADGKETRLAFGAFPDVSLGRAGEARRSAPVAGCRYGSGPRAGGAGAPGAAGGAEYLRACRARLASDHDQQVAAADRGRNPAPLRIGYLPGVRTPAINKVQAPDVLDAIRAIEQRGALEIANRQTANCSRVFKYAIRCGLAERNPAEFLREVLQPREKGHFAAISADGLPEFLRALYTNEACMGVPTHISMRLILLVFVRTSELIETPWAEIVLEKGEWIIPWKRMKRGKRRINPDKTDHHVCLSRQALALLRDLNRHTGGGTYLFPNLRDPKRPMSNNTLLKAIERMGYKGDMTGHGFRALAMSTLKENLGYRHEVVDRQLAHAQKDKLESAYDRATYLEERRKMMQCWADYIDRVTADAMRAPPGRSDNSMP